MLRSTKQLIGDKLGASDGEIGHVKDFYFDDQDWVIRYVVADTSSWLPGRQVLLSPHAFGRFNQTDKVLRVNLTRQQIENSPPIELHKPVSRQYEDEYFQYYGWPAYWQGDALWGMSGFPVAGMPLTPLPGQQPSPPPRTDRADAHLQSTGAVHGYSIEARDGTVGHVQDFMIDNESWAISELIVKMGHHFSGKEVQIATSKVTRISYDKSTVFVDLTRADFEQSPEHYLVNH
jgi:hypothetical protein